MDSKRRPAAAVEPVAFRCKALNTTFEVRGGASQVNDPAAMVHPDVKQAEFREGLFSTTDPEIIDFLDTQPEVWRASDPEGELKAQYGPAEYERLRKVFGTKGPSPEPAEEKED